MIAPIDTTEFIATLRKWGATIVRVVDTAKLAGTKKPCPTALRLDIEAI